MKHRVYFAHPVNTYDTPLEQLLLSHIALKWNGDTIVNPSDGIHKVAVARIKATDPNANVMGYFTDLVKSCNEVVVLPFKDGKWGAGVYKEVEAVLDFDVRIWVIDPHTFVIKGVHVLDPALCLSVEETRARVYQNEKRDIRPYS